MKFDRVKANMKTSLIALTLSAFLAGCASSKSETDVDPLLSGKDSPTFFSGSGWGACATGAAVTGLSCLLLKKEDKAVCLAAAAGGCAVAMSANYLLDKVRSDYKNTEDQLTAVKQNIDESITTTQALTATTQKLIEKDKLEIASIKKKIANGEADKTALENKLKQMDANIAKLNKEKEASLARIEQHKTAVKELATNSKDKKEMEKLIKEEEKFANNLANTCDTYFNDRNSYKS